jgi:hypothetical protein
MAFSVSSGYIADRSVGLYLSVLLTTVTKVAGRGPAAPG